MTLRSGQIANCTAINSNTGATFGGGGVCVDSGVFTLTGTGSINHNSAYNGGGVLLRNASSRFVMTGGEICDNTAQNPANLSWGIGGGLYNNGGTVQITAGTIKNNVAVYGGGVYTSGGKFSVSGTGNAPVLIQDNTASNQGGGIYTNGQMTLSNVKISGNKTTNSRTDDVTRGAGGGIYQGDGTTSFGDGTVITENNAVRGGGVYQVGGTLNMLGGEIIGNTAQLGGGVAQHPTGSGTFRFMRGKFYENRSTLTSTGNDVYSAYEGSESYPTLSGHPKFDLIAAVQMGNSKYNAWKDDVYTGSERTSPFIRKGQYITANISESDNLQLTASYYQLVNPSTDFDTDVKLTGFHFRENKDGVSGGFGWKDGNGTWDTESAAGEKTAQQLLSEGAAGAAESTETYEVNGQTYQYITIVGVNYERDEAVNWVPGDDSNDHNGVVRTYDSLLYDLRTYLTLDEKAFMTGGEGTGGEGTGGEGTGGEGTGGEGTGGEGTGGEGTGGEGTGGGSSSIIPDEEKNKKRTIHYWVEIVLPLSSEEGTFNSSCYSPNSGMKGYTITETEQNGKTVQILRGYYEHTFASENEEFTKSYRFDLAALKNGDKIKPTFKAWIEDSLSTPEEHAFAISAPRETVSAVGVYNVTLLNNIELSYTGYFDLTTGEEVNKTQYDPEHNPNVVFGTILGYGLSTELYNTKTSKGLLGIELPKDGMNFDLRMVAGLTVDAQPLIDRQTGEQYTCAPYIWAFKENEKGTYGRALGETTWSYNMDWNDEDDVDKTTSYAYNAAPFNSGGGANRCYSGGGWSLAANQPAASDSETLMHFTINGYKFNTDRNPTQTSDGQAQEPFQANNVKAFSAAYLQMLYPLRPEVIEQANGYLAINAKSAASDMEAITVSDQAPGHSSDDVSTLESYFGEGNVGNHGRNEMTYKDNYLLTVTGLYVYHGSGDGGGGVVSTDHFTSGNGATALSTRSGEDGNGATPLDTVVYTVTTATYTSPRIRTDDPNDVTHYIPDDKFDPQIHNKEERNYATAMNILQKFDPEAYTPYGCDPIINMRYDPGSTDSNERSAIYDRTGGAFIVTNNESKVNWVDQESTHPQSFTLTVLYGAKPNGSAWEKNDNTDGTDDGGVPDMDSYGEADLVYYTSLAALEADGKTCVAILYELRNTCIRGGKKMVVKTRMKVSDDFDKTGHTFCFVDETRLWTNYRLDYKLAFLEGEQKIQELVAVPSILDSAERPAVNASDISSGYIKTEYENGSQKPNTHSGWRKGNTLLLHTLDTKIEIYVTDRKSKYSSSAKDTYNVSNGERMASFRMEPFIKASSGVLNVIPVIDSTQSTEIEITLTLPKYLNYEPGTISFDYSPTKDQSGHVIDENENIYHEGEMTWDIIFNDPVVDSVTGETTIRLRTAVTDINKRLPFIDFKAKIGDEVDPSKDIPSSNYPMTTKATIHAVYEEQSQLAATDHSATVKITAIRVEGDGVYKGALTYLNEIGDDFGFRLVYSNSTTRELEDGTLIGDVMPYNGDGRETVFHGGYRFTDIEMIFTGENAEHTYEEYCRDGGFLKYLPSQTSMVDTGTNTSEFEEWRRNFLTQTFRDPDVTEIPATTTEISDEHDRVVLHFDSNVIAGIPATMANDTAANAFFCNIPMFGGMTSIQLVIKMSALDGRGKRLLVDEKGQSGNDLYVNNYHYIGGDNAYLSTLNCETRIVQRTLTGMVFMDPNHDGRFSTAESDGLISGVKAELYRVENDGTLTPARDIIRQPIAPVITGPDGKYSFTNLAPGNYKVKFSDPENDYLYLPNSAEGDITKAEHPIDFGKLSVTLLSEYTKIAADANRSEPTYDGQNLSGAQLWTEVTLPDKDNIRTGHHITANWNLGLYYVRGKLEKDWVKIIGGLPVGAEAIFKITQQGSTDVVYTGDFKLTDSGVSFTDSPQSASMTLVTSGDNEKPVWKAQYFALRAEAPENGTPKPIVYTFTEETKGIGNMRVSTVTFEPELEKVNGIVNGITLFKATNTMELTTITVKKLVEGSLGNRYKVFDFTVTIPLLASRTVETEGDISSLTFTNGVAKFKLKHDQSVTIPDVPIGAEFKVEEATTTSIGYETRYEATYKLKENDTVTVKPDQSGTGKSVEGITKEEETVTLYNKRDSVIPAGVALSLMLPLLLILVGAGGYFALKKRKKKA